MYFKDNISNFKLVKRKSIRKHDTYIHLQRLCQKLSIGLVSFMFSYSGLSEVEGEDVNKRNRT